MSKLKTTQTTNYQFDNITCEQNPSMTFKEYVFVDNNENWTKADEVIKLVEDGVTTNKADLVNVKSDIVEIKERIKEGIKGDRGQSAYEVAVEEGFIGTVDKWLESLKGEQGEVGQDGREIELRRHETHIQYKYAGEPDTAWRNVIALESITGPRGANGTNGKQIELQKNATHVQWRYQGEEAWNNLIELSSIKGDRGESGANGREIEFQKSDTHIQWKYSGDSEWNNLVDIASLKGDTGATGANGKNIELKKSDTHIQWRVAGAESWNNLIPLADLKGQKGDRGESADISQFYTKNEVYNKSEVDEKITNVSSGGSVDLTNYYNKQQVDQKISEVELTPGPKGEPGQNGKNVELQKTETHIQWKHNGESQWNNLVELNTLKGAQGATGVNGREIELKKSDTHIQYRYIGEGEAAWKNVVALQDIKGATGERGLQGIAGVNGKNIELQKSSTHIQWRVAGEGSWNNLVALSDLQGKPGSDSGQAISKEEVDLPFYGVWTNLDGYTSKIVKYGDVVTVYIALKYKTGSTVGGNIARIPEGYKPRNSFAIKMGGINTMPSWYIQVDSSSGTINGITENNEKIDRFESVLTYIV